MQQKIYAFFDFDGTLIVQDSFLLLLKMALIKSPWRLLFLAIFVPVFIFTYIFKCDKSLAKSLTLWAITAFKGRKKTIKFLTQSLLPLGEQLWLRQASAHLAALKKENIGVVIVSASGQIWLRALLRPYLQDSQCIIGSRLKFFLGGVILQSKNCYGAEKLKRIKEILGTNFIWHSAWSDHIADLPMLKMAPKAYLINPTAKHLKIFQQELQNFSVYNWTVT